MEYLLGAVILAVCACLSFFFPQLLNVLTKEQKRRMDRRKVGLIAFIGLMTPAVILFIFYACGVEHELIPPLVVIPFAIGTAVAVQLVVK